MSTNKFFDKSIFKQYFDSDDDNVLTWANNVLEKLKAKGGVAEYILREDDEIGETDFENYYLPIAIFWGYFVQLAREFETFTDDDFLLNEYLIQHGLFTSGKESIIDLFYEMSNSLRIRAQRGGIKSIEISEDDNISSGEVLRLLNWDSNTFFKLGVAQSYKNGWCLDNSSPLFKGNSGRYDLNIGYEYTEDVENLSAYPIITPESVFLSRYRGKNCMEIEQPLQDAGIGGDDVDKRIIIDPRLDFEITLEIAQDITNENITFGCKAFDINGNEISLKNVVDDSDSNFFFETRRLNKAGTWYLLRGIIYNKDKGTLSANDARLNIGFGHCLKFPENVVSIVPQIYFDINALDDQDTEQDNFDSISIDIDSGGGSDSAYDLQPSIFLWNIKLTPCSLSYERAYLNNRNFIDIIADNKNGRYSNDEIRVFLRKYFANYNTAFNVLFLDEISVTPIIETFYLALESDGHFLLEDGYGILLE